MLTSKNIFKTHKSYQFKKPNKKISSFKPSHLIVNTNLINNLSKIDDGCNLTIDNTGFVFSIG